MADWLVKHKEHWGEVIDEFHPLNLTFNMVLDDADDINYDIPLAHPKIRWHMMGPKRTEFELWRGDLLLMSGPHSYSGSRRGSEVANCQGKSWLWYLQNRHYPFNAAHATDFLGGTAADKQGIAYQAIKPPGQIIHDLLTITLARQYSAPITIASLPNAGPDTKFRIELADTESIYDKIKQLSEMGTSGEGEVGGFNFDINPQKQFVVWHPQRFPDAARDSPGACIHTFDDLTPPTELVEVEFQNNGPEMTHILAMGAGTALKKPARSYSPGEPDRTQRIFQRWDGSVNFSDVFDDKEMTSLTQHHFSAAMYPQITLPMTVKPEAITNFWTKFRPGEAVWVNIDFEIRRVEMAFKINGMRVTVDNQGDETVELELEQIMPLGNVGINEG